VLTVKYQWGEGVKASAPRFSRFSGRVALAHPRSICTPRVRRTRRKRRIDMGSIASKLFTELIGDRNHALGLSELNSPLFSACDKSDSPSWYVV